MNSAGSDFRLYHGNDLSLLAGVLSETLRQDLDPESMLAPETILIPQPAMKRWLQMVLAEQHGIAANLRFLTPGEFVRLALHANEFEATSHIFSADSLRWRLFSVLQDKKQWLHPAMQSIAPYLRGTQAELKAWSLANECAAAFEKYQAWRRDWCLDWDRGLATLDWQAHLWREVTKGKNHRGQAIAHYLDAFEATGKPAPKGLPSRLFVFACLNVSPDVLRVIATAAKAGPLHFFLPSPSKKYWGDLPNFRERLKNRSEDVFEQEDNPLLQHWGRAGRDFIATLFSNHTVELRGDVDMYVSSDKPGLLARVKNDLLERQSPRPLSGEFDISDTSLQIHSCHTSLREVQVLHDQLHRLFLVHQHLQAREIAIMAPDIDAYAPFIEAVFGAARNTPRFIPYRLSDRNLQHSSALIDLFLRLLDLPQLELTSNEVLDILSAPAMATHLEVDEDCQRWWPFWIEQAGARWGLNAAHRKQHDVPAEHLTTWAFALDRLLLGYASGSDTLIQGVSPLPEIEGQTLNTLDKLIRGLRLLARYNEYFRQAHAAADWANGAADLLAIFEASTKDSASEVAALQRCREACADLLEQCRLAELEELIGPEIIRDYFRQALSEDNSSQNFLSGGVTVCRMVPMRQIPFKVICLLGLNEGDMPRCEPPGFIQRLSDEIKSPITRRYGDRSLRDDDRFLFLQLLTAADTTLYLSYCGKHPRDDTELAPSSLISELLECLATMYPEQPDFRKKFVVQHPLQVFSVDGDADTRSPRFDPAWQLSSHGDDKRDLRFVRDAIPEVGALSGHKVAWQDFKRFFKHPPKFFLQHRLGMRLEENEELLDDHEPFGIASGLHRHDLRHAVFNALAAAEKMPSDQELLALLRSQALLPAGYSAEQSLNKTLHEVKQQALRFKKWRVGAAAVLPFELKLGPHVLHGSLEGIYPNGAARIVLGEMRGRHHCMQGLDALLLSALNQGIPLMEFAELKKGEPLQRIRPAHNSEDAIKHLTALMDLFIEGQQRPLPFHPDAGFIYARHGHGEAVELNEKAWEKVAEAMPENDLWWTTAMRGNDPFVDHGEQADSVASRIMFRDMSVSVFGACTPEFIGSGDDGDE